MERVCRNGRNLRSWKKLVPAVFLVLSVSVELVVGGISPLLLSRPALLQTPLLQQRQSQLEWLFRSGSNRRQFRLEEEDQFPLNRPRMRTVYTIYFVLATSFFAGIVIAGVLQLTREQVQPRVAELAVRSKRQLLQILRPPGNLKGILGSSSPPSSAFSGSAANAAASTASQTGLGGLPAIFSPGQGAGVSGSAASANAVAQNVGGAGGFSGSNAAANSLSQNIGGHGFSGSNANANAFGQNFGPAGFGASAANAQAQSFQSNGPLGSFGASASNAASQGFSAGPGGLSGSAGFAGSQTYNLPGDRTVSLAYSKGVSLANGQPAASNGFSVTYS